MDDTEASESSSADRAVLVRACVYAGRLGIVPPVVAADAATHVRGGGLPGPASASYVLGIDVTLMGALVAVALAAPPESDAAQTVGAPRVDQRFLRGPLPLSPASHSSTAPIAWGSSSTTSTTRYKGP